MAGCNDSCNCLLEGDDGIEVDGLGSAASPYVIGTEDGRLIPYAMTAAERTALSVTDDDIGLIAYETDTGIAWAYDGAAEGWRRLSVYAVAAEAASTTLNQPTTDKQSIVSLALGAGVWALHGKGNIEASLSAGTGWDAYLWDDTAGVELDLTSMAVSGGEVPAGSATFWRPFALQDLVTLTVASTVALRVRRASTGGTQLVVRAKLMASGVPGVRP